MKVLIVAKPSNWELHKDKLVKHLPTGGLAQLSMVRLEKMHQQHYQCIHELCDLLDRRQIPFDLIQRDDGQIESHYDYYLSVGGDGTLLSVARHLKATQKLIGICSSDESIGYTCAADYRSIEKLVNLLCDNKLEFKEVSRMSVHIQDVESGPKLLPPVLNDVLFANSRASATSRYAIYLNGEVEVHKSSGVWLATAVGSTAGILAAGGQQMDWDERCFQYRVREPYQNAETSHHLLGGFINPDQDDFRIENHNERAIIALDGQHGEYQLNFGDCISIKRAESLWILPPDVGLKQDKHIKL